MKRLKILATVLLILCVISVVYIFVVHVRTTTTPSALARCANHESYGYQLDTSCARSTIDSLLRKMSTDEIMSYIVASTTPSSITDLCHPIGHLVGEETFKIADSLESALRKCPESCRLACEHGVIANAMSAETGQGLLENGLFHADLATIEKLGEKYCSRDRQEMCHVVGHLLFATTQDNKKSLEECKKIGDPLASSFRKQLCYAGVVMEESGERGDNGEAFGPTNPTPPSQDFAYPCDGVAEIYRHACFRYLPDFQSTLFRDHHITATSTMVSIAKRTCESFSGRSRVDCFEGIGLESKQYLGYFKFSPEKQVFCEQFSTRTDRMGCDIGTVSHLALIGQWSAGVRFCDGLKDASAQKACYGLIFQLVWDEGMPPSKTHEICASVPGSTCEVQFRLFSISSSTLPRYKFGLYGEMK